MTTRVTAPSPVDGWFLALHLETILGVKFHKILRYDGMTNELMIEDQGLTQEIIDGIPAAVASYVHPVDTAKIMTDITQEYYP